METLSLHTETTELHFPSDINVSSSLLVTTTQSDPPTRKTYSTRIHTAVQRYEPKW